ncbi:MAG TPA: ribulose-phosphate 3-epimerase [Aquifex aeolicus]|uniref:Ribulose-phosphate 3-epimerase n=1 Tax=Aquifex aeolicus TaxID=63363 RepID=A0A9D0YQG1_AQUAO|nr:ribulose-phosphate 3-epimerase [Aquificales bacterium]HIP98285.1 ribulose-phosphate 3-epimerase [Aquifex aeolicus]HIQ26803.1 ribulose-phosphate 3-epimerase [Aquifex aeolicus]
MVEKKLLPSILNADFWNLEELILATLKGGADGLHMDVMDGHFVPNLTFGASVVGAVAKRVNTFIDSHLMVEEPSRWVEEFVKNRSNAVSVHWEAEKHLHRTVSLIKSLGAKAGVVINPATPVEVLEEILPFSDFVLVMSVNPGFGGQKFISTSLRKIEKLKNLLVKLGLEEKVSIEVDGGIKLNNIEDVLKAGADWIVVGSAIFSSSDAKEVENNTKRFKEVLEKFL